MKRNKVPQRVITVLLIIVLTFLEIMLLPTLVLSSFINHNTAAYMLFDVPIEETWEQPADYKWNDTDEAYLENVSDDYAALTDIPFEVYNKWHYLDKMSTIFMEKGGLTENDIELLWNNSSIDAYINEFVKMQAGYLVGDNMLPTPYLDDINKELDASVTRLNNEKFSSWYNENGTALKASLKHAMVKSNEVLQSKLLDKNLAFGETCSILKIFNIMIVFYVVLSLVVIIGYILFKLFGNAWTYSVLIISHVTAMLATSATYMDMTSFNLVVFGIPYSPTKEMVRSCAPMYVFLMIVFALITFIMLNKKYFIFKKLKSVIFKKTK
jgi:hypothetical protein